jgi:hypothetical protein
MGVGSGSKPGDVMDGLIESIFYSIFGTINLQIYYYITCHVMSCHGNRT